MMQFQVDNAIIIGDDDEDEAIEHGDSFQDSKDIDIMADDS